MKKLLTEISVEELLELSQREDLKFELDPVKDKIIHFISFFNIKSGSYQIDKKFIYKVFQHWNDNQVRMTKEVFYHYLHELFGLSDNKYVLIDKTLIKLTDAAFEYTHKKIIAKSDTTIAQKENDINLFLNSFDIKKGTVKASIFLIHRTYSFWAIANRKVRLKSIMFQKIIKNHLDITISEGKKFTYIDTASADKMHEFMLNEKIKQENKKQTIKKIQEDIDKEN